MRLRNLLGIALVLFLIMPFCGTKEEKNVETILSSAVVNTASAVPRMDSTLPTYPPEPEPPLYKNWNDTVSVPEEGIAIKINKNLHKMRVYDHGEIIAEYSVSTGLNPGDKTRVGDRKTPEGRFRIIQKQDASTWQHEYDESDEGMLYAYGPYFLRLEVNEEDTFNGTGTWTGIGIHGTCIEDHFDRNHEYVVCGPKSIGTNVSEGCIRMRTQDLLELVDTLGANFIGTPVIIVDGIERR